MAVYDAKQPPIIISKRIKYYDVLKAVAIIAVVLYHIGVCQNGYLGVDVFFVLAGFFTSNSIDNHIATNRWYFKFIKQRIFRILPLLIIAGIICMAFGWFMMLPDDYENAAQSVVATNFFGNNILQAITTRDY
jgi:peptidoglycan/LPS O-acetylase OafA/YrhL